jgi:hypothetical protein
MTEASTATVNGVLARKAAYIVGGAPSSVRNLEQHLKEEGVDVVGSALYVSEMGAIPKSADFVLHLKDASSHSMTEKLDKLLGDRSMLRVSGSAFSWSATRRKLEDAGVLGVKNIFVPPAHKITAMEPEAAPAVEAAPEANPAPQEETMHRTEAKPTHPQIARSRRIRDAVKEVLEKRKDTLRTFTNVELAAEVGKILGEKVNQSTVGVWRIDMKYAAPPKGYKRPRIQRDGARSKGTRSGKEIAGAVIVGPAEAADTELRTILGFLDDWKKKHNVQKAYIALDSGNWDSNYEQVAIVTRQVKLS